MPPLFSHMGRSSSDPGLFQRVKNYVTGTEEVPGLRPQDDESMRVLIGALRNPGLGMGENNRLDLAKRGITGPGIIQAALRTPGYMPIETRPLLRGLDYVNPFALKEAVKLRGVQGTTPPTPEGMRSRGIRIYPENNRPGEEITNTTLHELIHGMRVNRELNTQGPGMEETTAYYGTGTHPKVAFEEGNIDYSRRPEVDKALQDLLRY